jgi:hypothetical protein
MKKVYPHQRLKGHSAFGRICCKPRSTDDRYNQLPQRLS